MRAYVMRRWRSGCVRLAVLAVALVAGVFVSMGTPLSSAQQGEDAAALRELAVRLLAEDGGRSGRTYSVLSGGIALPPPPAVDLRVGEMPERLPVSLPVPPGGRLLGSYDRQDRVARTWEIVLDVPVGTGDPRAFYEQILTSAGWTRARSPFAALDDEFGGGFVDREGLEQERRLRQAAMDAEDRDTFRRSYCPPAGAGNTQLTVATLSVANGYQDVRLHGERTGNLLCSRPGDLDLPRAPVQLPSLLVPDDVSIVKDSGSSSQRPVGSGEVVRSTRSVSDLEGYFAGLLRDAGWTRLDGGAETLLGWSTWRVAGDTGWEAYLAVIARPGTDLRYLVLEARPPR